MLTLKNPEPPVAGRRATASPDSSSHTDSSPGTGSHPVRITYGAAGNYARPAHALARAIRDEFDVETRLEPSSGVVFEVEVCGDLIFSKRATWRLPDHDEIFFHVRRRVG